MGLHSESKLVRKFTEFAKILNTYLNHFPKHEKYGLALEIRRAAYDVFGLLVEGQKRYHKKTSLSNLDIRHEQLRMFLGLANDLGYFGFRGGEREDSKDAGVRRFLTISKWVDELGCMIGGWINSEKEKERQKEAVREAS